MILSRLIARQRIAAGNRPSFKAAWGLVAVDTALIALLLALLWSPLVAALDGVAFGLKIVILLVTLYGPLQVVIIVSTIWAIKSRWQGEDKT